MWEWLEELTDWWTGDDDSDSDSSSQDSYDDDKNYYGADQDMSANIEYNDLFDDEGNFTGLVDSKNYYGADDLSWIDDFNFGDELFNTDTSPEGQISAWMDDYLSSGASTEGIDYTDFLEGGDYYSEPEGGGLGEIISQFLGGGGQKREGNKLGKLGQGLGSLLDSPLMQLLLLKDKYDGRKADLYIPKGQEAYGGAGEQPSYQNTNTQHTLLPGMAYANSGPPGMQAGGLASISQGNNMGYMQAGGLTSHNHPQLHSHGPTPGIERGPGLPPPPASKVLFGDGMQAGGVASLENRMDGPGDITQAMLEPGEFVMTRKATENLTPEYLYKLMHQAENAGRMT